MLNKFVLKYLTILLVFILLTACSQEEIHTKSRIDSIPVDANKVTPEEDASPPVLHSDEYQEPIPLIAINTAGAEDSPFIPIGKDEIYFFFTPDVRVPVEKQILDGVTGIYVSKYENDAWQEAERVMLQDSKKLSLDGCEFVQGNMMLFCTVRDGYAGIHWFSAELKEGRWKNWRLADNLVKEEEYETGELHIWNDELYFHSGREGGKGQYDIWMMKKTNGEWLNPINVEAVNSADNDGWPYLTSDGQELWFTRTYLGTPAIFLSKRLNSEWQEPELIISQFAGEPTLDKDGNLYFVHHYYKDGKMIEADIYVAYKK